MELTRLSELLPGLVSVACIITLLVWRVADLIVRFVRLSRRQPASITIRADEGQDQESSRLRQVGAK